MNDQPSFLSRLGPALRRRVTRARNLARYATHEFVRDPGLELYSYAMARQNRRHALDIKNWHAQGVDPRYEPLTPRLLPKIVWIYWAQGLEAAPPLVRRCVESWQRHNPGWEVRVLDAADAQALVDLSDIPEVMPQRVFANALRLRLLSRQGGVWADATVLCHRPLDGWLPLHMTSGFFVFRDPGPSRWVDSWFIASEPGGVLATAWERMYSAYITNCHEKSGKYFMVMYCFQWAVRTSPEAREVWRQTAALPAVPTLLMMSVIEGRTPL